MRVEESEERHEGGEMYNSRVQSFGRDCANKQSLKTETFFTTAGALVNKVCCYLEAAAVFLYLVHDCRDRDDLLKKWWLLVAIDLLEDVLEPRVVEQQLGEHLL